MRISGFKIVPPKRIVIRQFYKKEFTSVPSAIVGIAVVGKSKVGKT